jgi:uncharacterized protein
MSQENVEVVRRIFETWSRGDFEAAVALMDPGIEWYDPPRQPGPVLRVGHAGVEESLREWMGAWEEWNYDAHQFIDLGHAVLQIGRQSGRGKGSQVEVADDLFHVWKLRDGRAVEMRMFTDRAEALEALGLPK